MRNSYGRRIALRRPKRDELDAIAAEIATLEAIRRRTRRRASGSTTLREELEELERRRRLIAYVDPVDIRFNRFEPQPLPNANAVMFCLMDVSGSMGEREKDLAKRFFVLLHLFLKRRYDRIDIVFIRHTARGAGGRRGDLLLQHAKRRHGGVDRAGGDAPDHRRALSQPRVEHLCGPGLGRRQHRQRFRALRRAARTARLMRLCQYFAYVEIIDERESHIFGETDNGTSLWRAYRAVAAKWANFQMTRIAKPSDIYPVFRKLFAKQPAHEEQLRVSDGKHARTGQLAVFTAPTGTSRRCRAPTTPSRRSRSRT